MFMVHEQYLDLEAGFLLIKSGVSGLASRQSPIVSEDDMTPQQENIPFGICQCGCGAQVIKRRNSKGLYVHGHGRRTCGNDYTEECRGYKTKCWIWTRHTTKDGYGRKTVAGKVGYAHIWYFERHRERVPEGFEVDHLCRVRNCVRPDHLEAVPPEVNTQRRADLKMTREKVVQLRNLRASGATLKAAAALFGITPGYASEICRRTSWRNVV